MNYRQMEHVLCALSSGFFDVNCRNRPDELRLSYDAWAAVCGVSTRFGYDLMAYECSVDSRASAEVLAGLRRAMGSPVVAPVAKKATKRVAVPDGPCVGAVPAEGRITAPAAVPLSDVERAVVVKVVGWLETYRRGFTVAKRVPRG